MKAIIYNSGSGKRMGRITQNQPKCLVKLSGKETIFERQLRILSECGIREIIVTTGKNENALRLTAKKFPQLHFTFVNNTDYDATNYIYSMYLSAKYLEGDLLSLHGDLVFDKGLIEKMLNSSELSLCLVNKKLVQPTKDFKCRLENDFLREVSVNLFDEDCYAFQPLYKLSKQDIKVWLEEVKRFVENGNRHVYAEEALNVVLKDLSIRAMSYENHYIDEIDTPEDLERVQFEIEQFEIRQRTLVR